MECVGHVCTLLIIRQLFFKLLIWFIFSFPKLVFNRETSNLLLCFHIANDPAFIFLIGGTC